MSALQELSQMCAMPLEVTERNGIIGVWDSAAEPVLEIMEGGGMTHHETAALKTIVAAANEAHGMRLALLKQDGAGTVRL